MSEVAKVVEDTKAVVESVSVLVQETQEVVGTLSSQATEVVTQQGPAVTEVVQQSAPVVEGVSMFSGSLEAALADMITRATTSAGKATDFLVAEVPEVLEQLVMWYGVKSGLLCLIGVIGLIFTVRFIKRNSGCGKQKDDGKYRYTLTHDSYGTVGPHCLALVASLAPFIGFYCLLNLEWLQILIAPKVWLIQYGAELTRNLAG